MLSSSQIATHTSGPYAVPGDFCRLFEQEMDRLYLLAHLLTGNQAQAESCFVQGLEDATNSSRVFKEWAERWARRMIIQNAIQIAHPREGSRSSDAASHVDTASPAMEIISELPLFERFVFIMSVLERYSDQDCSLLLDCTRGDVIAARTRALQQIARLARFEGESLQGGHVGVPSASTQKSAPRLVYA